LVFFDTFFYFLKCELSRSDRIFSKGDIFLGSSGSQKTETYFIVFECILRILDRYILCYELWVIGIGRICFITLKLDKIPLCLFQSVFLIGYGLFFGTESIIATCLCKCWIGKFIDVRKGSLNRTETRLGRRSDRTECCRIAINRGLWEGSRGDTCIHSVSSIFSENDESIKCLIQSSEKCFNGSTAISFNGERIKRSFCPNYKSVCCSPVIFCLYLERSIFCRKVGFIGIVFCSVCIAHPEYDIGIVEIWFRIDNLFTSINNRGLKNFCYIYICVWKSFVCCFFEGKKFILYIHELWLFAFYIILLCNNLTFIIRLFIGFITQEIRLAIFESSDLAFHTRDSIFRIEYVLIGCSSQKLIESYLCIIEVHFLLFDIIQDIGGIQFCHHLSLFHFLSFAIKYLRNFPHLAKLHFLLIYESGSPDNLNRILDIPLFNRRSYRCECGTRGIFFEKIRISTIDKADNDSPSNKFSSKRRKFHNIMKLR